MMNEQDQQNPMMLGMKFGQLFQGIIAAGIIGLFVQFNDVRDAVNTSAAERKALKEDLQELKDEIRILRGYLYRKNYGDTDAG